jgi:formylglycine-generating enzyme required for sulfatase activity
MTRQPYLQSSLFAFSGTAGMTWGTSLLAQAQSAPTASPLVSVNSVGMKFVRIPAGEFMMCNNETVASLQADFLQLEVKRLDELSDEMPLHRVKISRAFDLGQTEVTRAQFEQFLNLSGYVPESVRDKTGGYGYSVQHDRNRPEKADAFAGRDPAYSSKRWVLAHMAHLCALQLSQHQCARQPLHLAGHAPLA